jgi:hypothetical protein
MLETEDYESVLRLLPPVELAFSYGSGVFQQSGYDYSSTDPKSLPMCDFIFAVEDPIEVSRRFDSGLMVLIVASSKH